MITEQQDKALQELGYTGDMAMDIDKAIRWMREVKGVHVSPYIDFEVWKVALMNTKTMSVMYVYAYTNFYQSHDLAQSAGLDAAIDYVKKKQQHHD